jgi:hypothetical protein
VRVPREQRIAEDHATRRPPLFSAAFAVFAAFMLTVAFG